jgi:hypothetical protein
MKYSFVVLGIFLGVPNRKKGRADIYFSRSVGKDIPARPTLLVVWGGI